MKCAKCNFRNTSSARFCVQCGAELIRAATPTENIRSSLSNIERGSLLFDRYEVIEEIGSGGMGSVYRVFDQKINEIIALKVIKREIATDAGVIERFNQELKTARKIAHRNVCRMFDIGEADGTHYITMEYITGEDLRSLISRIGQLPVGKTVNIARQVCEGLAEAHAMGVVHRDLKPQNIMLDRDGNAKIMDFGIARFMRAKGLTTTGTIIGTPEYMSPEQAEGRGADQRSDIYSLGILLFEALTGTVPFDGETPLSVALKHKTESPPDPRKINSQIPEALGALVLKCLEKNKERRYQSVSEILADLDMIEKGVPPRRASGVRRKPLTAREITVKLTVKKVLARGAVILVVVAVAVGAWRFWPRRGPTDSVVGEPARQENESGKTATQAEGIGGSSEEDISSKTAPPETEKRETPPVDAKTAENPSESEEADRIATAVNGGLSAASRAYSRGFYQESLKESRKVLDLDPKNAQALNYVKISTEKLTEADINALVDRYVRSFASGGPADFYKANGTSRLYEEIGPDAKMLSDLYEQFAPSISNRSIALTGSDRAEAVFYQRLTATRKGTGMEQELSVGTMRWKLQKLSGKWKISEWAFEPSNASE